MKAMQKLIKALKCAKKARHARFDLLCHITMYQVTQEWAIILINKHHNLVVIRATQILDQVTNLQANAFCSIKLIAILMCNALKLISYTTDKISKSSTTTLRKIESNDRV